MLCSNSSLTANYCITISMKKSAQVIDLFLRYRQRDSGIKDVTENTDRNDGLSAYWNVVFSFFSYFIQSRVFLSVAYLTVANLARLGISVHCQVSVFIQAPLLVLDYRWSHNPPNYRRTVTLNWYLTHSVPKFSLQNSCITDACHYTLRTTTQVVSRTTVVSSFQRLLQVAVFFVAEF